MTDETTELSIGLRIQCTQCDWTTDRGGVTEQIALQEALDEHVRATHDQRIVMEIYGDGD